VTGRGGDWIVVAPVTGAGRICSGGSGVPAWDEAVEPADPDGEPVPGARLRDGPDEQAARATAVSTASAAPTEVLA
jgi:hypothetical protein